MRRYLFMVLFYMLSVNAMGQDNDSLIAAHRGTTWLMRYTVKPGENMQMLARRFYVSDGAIAYANEQEGPKKLTPGDVINIPLTKENYFSAKQPFDQYHELYYHVVGRDNISLISTYSGVTKDDIRTWNNLHGYTLEPGEALFVGWVKMMDRDTTNPVKMAAYPVVRKMVSVDSQKIVVPGGLDTIYNRQTNNGMSVLTEKGTAVFFDKTGKNNIFYAFHNTTPRGTVIKVTNPGTGKTIFVKVLDKVPDTKLYSNSIIGISSSAREALGVNDTKAWVEISYPAN